MSSLRRTATNQGGPWVFFTRRYSRGVREDGAEGIPWNNDCSVIDDWRVGSYLGRECLLKYKGFLLSRLPIFSGSLSRSSPIEIVSASSHSSSVEPSCSLARSSSLVLSSSVVPWSVRWAVLGWPCPSNGLSSCVVQGWFVTRTLKRYLISRQAITYVPLY